MSTRPSLADHAGIGVLLQMAEDRHPDRRAISDRLLSAQKLGGPTRDYRWQVGGLGFCFVLSICINKNKNKKEACTEIRSQIESPFIGSSTATTSNLSRHRAWSIHHFMPECELRLLS